MKISLRTLPKERVETYSKRKRVSEFCRFNLLFRITVGGVNAQMAHYLVERVCQHLHASSEGIEFEESTGNAIVTCVVPRDFDMKAREQENDIHRSFGELKKELLSKEEVLEIVPAEDYGDM